MFDIERFNEFKDDLLYFILKEENKYFVEKAKERFFIDDEHETGLGFTSWLIHDCEIDGRKAVDIYSEKNTDFDQDYLLVMKNSLFSFYELIKTQNNTILKDIITRKDYLLSDEDKNIDGELLAGRIYFIKDKIALSDEITSFERSFVEVFRKGILEKYNEYTKMSGMVSIDDFVEGNPIIFYKYLDVADQSDAIMNFDDDDLRVYQGIFGFSDKKEVIKILKEDDHVTMLDDDEFIIVYEGERCELILLDNRFELECVTKSELEAFKQLVLEMFEEKVAHLGDEVITLDNLL